MHEEINLELENEQISCVSHNSLLNCLFVITSENKLILYDCNSKTRIKYLDWNKTLEKNNYEYVKIYNIQDKCIVATDFTICSRLAHDGYFLLDTVFQTSFKQNQVVMPNMKTLELNAFEAKGLLNALKQIESENVNGLDEIINQLKQQQQQIATFDSSSSSASSSLSSGSTDQWTTVRITDTYSNLLTILTQSLDEIKRTNIQSVAIQTISILLDRLYRLDYTLVETQLNNTIGVPFSNFDKRYMCSETTRRATYNQWPHMDYKWVLPDALAQAGFFHQPTHPGDDRTICFACDLCLVAWEQQDQPWSEHERHSPACQFVRGEVTENVPLAVTASNQCAHKIFKPDDFSEKVTCTSDISSERYFAVSNSTGHIVVYDCKDILKEMMHVQLINESQYNKDYPIKIHSLCFYYRNHKHVLYGSFTINNEVFIFSFNIFDIYRSYHSKSNKKSSKSHKNTTTTTTTTTTTNTVNLQTVKNSNAKTTTAIPNTTTATTNTNTTNTIMPSLNLNPSTMNIANKISVELNKNIMNGSGEFTTYINDIVKASIEEASKLTTNSTNSGGVVGEQSVTQNESSSSSTTPLASQNAIFTDLTLTKTEKILNKLEAISQTNKSISSTTNIPMKIATSSTSTTTPSIVKPVNSSNLSNFLVVRFETCVANQESSSSSSKAKSKYKKCIKILSVSSKPLSYFDSTSSANAANVVDIQLKTFEFTEKCLSFRLACLDLNQAELKNNFDIKIINLYEKYLCAVVNYETEDQISYYKLFKIKHEESSSAGNGNQQIDTTKTNVVPSKVISNESAISSTTIQDPTNVSANIQNCLLATSSSRLNLTEFILNCFTTTNSNARIISILPITVTTFDDEDDLHYIALLNNLGVISIIDPFKNCIVFEFPSISNEDKFVHITYCYGIDKICAQTESNKLHLISMRIFPIINQSILDESSDTIKLSEISLSKNLLVDAPLESKNLSILHELIFFETTKTNFTAKLPSVWSPILSDQNHQRKHPQHIHSETVNLTKSWRYTNKNNSSNSDNMMDNFTVEIFLNKPIQVGCIQLKLKFNKELVTPLEIRLFKQKKNFEIGKSSKNFDTKNDFNSSDKYELLFGPIDLREFLDASLAKTYIITISSDKILETRSNLLFLNFKFSDNNDERKTQSAQSSSLSSSSSSSAAQNYIQKIHLTLKKYKRTGLVNETLERGLMLVRRTFFINLLEMMMKTNIENNMIKILDILNWIFYNHFSIGSKVLNELMQIFAQYLEKFLVIFYIHGNRTVSKKATMLINFLLNKNVDADKLFASILFDNLINLFKYIPVFESSASLHWYFMLIHQVMNLDSKKSFDVCMDMLTKLSKGHKYNYLYALLKMRYNLSCLLFENTLFDADLYLKFDITHQKLIQNQQPLGANGGFSNPYSFSFGSVGIAINNNMNKTNINNNQMSSNTNSNQNNNANNNNLKNGNTFNNNISMGGLFNSNLLNSSIKDLNLLPQSMGLIEVLPLKFKYLSSSNGTTIEKNNNNNNSNSNSKQETPFYVLPDYFTFLDSNKQASTTTTTTTEQNKSQSESPVTEQVSQTFEPASNETSTPVDLSIFNSIFTFHPLQCLIVERMEPVSRHFVVIDFTFPVAITDIIIPTCSELSSLSIDYWLFKEQKDSKRLCVSTTISQNPILLNDLQPPIICRYIKLIYVSQSTNTAKAKIPIGYFFGHPYIFYDDFLPINEPNQNVSLPNIFRTPSLWSSYISYLEKLLEENQCHYLMSIAKLREFLNEIQFPSDNIGHLKMMQFNFNENSEFSNKIKNTYKECLDYQYKLNLNAKLLKRLRLPQTNTNKELNTNIKVESLIAQMSQDKLRVTCGLLIKSLLCLTFQITNSVTTTVSVPASIKENKIDLEKACILFRDLCVYGNYENECSLLLLRCCYNEPWWGQFISNCLKKFFVSQVKEVIPMSKAFITLNEICLKSLNGSQTNNLFECLFSLVNDILSPLDTAHGCVEVTSLEWILLFISRLLMSINNKQQQQQQHDQQQMTSCRWEFLENTCSNFNNKLMYSNQYHAMKPLHLIRNKTKIKKKIFQTNKYFNWNKMKDSRRTIDKNSRKQFSKCGGDANSFFHNNNDKYLKFSLKNKIHLPRDVSLRAGRSLAKLLLSANSFCSSDLFVLSCRIISSLCSNIQPSISFSEIINKNDLNQLILLNISSEFNHGSVSWGSPWSQHALLCLFMDIIENDKINNDIESNNKSCDQQQQQQQRNNNNNSKTFKFENETNNLKIIEENEELQSAVGGSSSSDASKNPYNLLQHLSDDLKCNILNEFKLKQENTESSNESTSNQVEQQQQSNTNKTDDSKNTLSVQNLNKYLHMNIHQLQTHLSKFPIFDINNQLMHTNNKGLKKNQISNYYPLIKNKSIILPNELQNMAISYDNRLDNSIFQTIETNLFINICIQNDSINRSVSEPLPTIAFPSLTTNFNFNDQLNMFSVSAHDSGSETILIDNTSKLNKSSSSSISLIQDTLEFIFRDLSTINIENLLTFWLTLAILDSEIKYDSSQDSLFYLNVKTASYLLEYLLNYSYMNVKLWHLSFRMLSVVISTSNKSSESIISTFVNSDSLYKFIYKFISSNEELAGDECCTSMSEFLLRLSDLIVNQELEKHFKKKLFEILCDCINENGCVNRHQGPLDAQVVFVEYLISEDILVCYDLETNENDNDHDDDNDDNTNNIELKNQEFEKMFARFFDSLSKLVHYHICVYPRLSIKGMTSPRSCFSGVLTSLLFGSRSLKVNNNNIKQQNDKSKGNGGDDFSFNSFKPASSQYGFGNLAKINLNNSNKNQFSNKFVPSNYNSNNNSNINNNNNKYSILCNRDNLVCLLLKMGINLISNFRSENKIQNYSKVQKQVDLLEKIIFEEQQQQNLTTDNNNSEMVQEIAFKDDQMSSQNNNNNNELYDDDLLLQQLFLYELQQIDEQVPNQNNINEQQQQQQNELDFCFENETIDKSNNDIVTDQDFYSSQQQQQQQQKIEEDEEEEEFMNIINNSTIKSDKLIQLISNESLELLIESLGLCQSSALAMVISNSSYPIELNLEDIQTPGDGLFLLLKYVSSTTPVKLVMPSYSYLNKIKRLSEPLLWFFSGLFSNEEAVNCFINMGGVEIISKGFALTTRQLLYSGPCIVSSLMNMIDSDRQNIKLMNNNYDNESTEGFTNFASFGSIMCTNPSGNPVDVLLQNTATHRRIRSAIWSYHFQPHEHKVSLFLTFPHTFLLKEVHVLPHTVSFGNCPAYVSLEVSRDGSFMTPIGPPIYTTGMLSIKLQLNKSELVNTIQINLYKSKDSQMIGLSQIRILGYPIFENMLSAKPDMMLTPVEDLVSRSNMGWLRLLYMCLTSVSSLEQFVCQNIQDSTIHLCIRLLSSPAMIIYDKIVETILLKLSKHNAKRGLEIIKALLHAENGLESGIYSVPHGVLIETLINILFEISEIKYDLENLEIVEKSRIDLIIDWLNECFEKRINSNNNNSFLSTPHRNPSNMLLHCVSCIIFKTTQELNINQKFVESMIEYSIYLNDYYSKQSIDWILCSVFSNKPNFLNVLIDMIDLNQLDKSLHMEDAYNDDDNDNLIKNKNVMSLLETLSVSIQSTQVLEIFINGDFFKNLVDLFIKILDKFYTESNQKLQLNILKIFVSIAEFSLGQNWFGQENSGSLVWQKLVRLLCYSNSSNELNNSEEICSAVIKLIKKMLFCNTSNQNKFSVYITKLIQEYVSANTSLTNNSGSKISGFLHQLILQVFLDDQLLTVNFQRKSKIFKISCNSSLGLLTHPRYGTGYDCCCLEISLQKTASEIINSITDVPISQMLNIDQKNTSSSLSNNLNNNNNSNSTSGANLLDMNSLLNNLKHYGESYQNEQKKQNINKAFENLKQPKINNESINNNFPKVNLVLKLPVDNSREEEEIILPNDMSLEKILGLYLSKTKQSYVQDLELNIQLSTGNDDYYHLHHQKNNFNLDEINKFVPSSPLDEFVKCDGLTILAERLPIFMPFIHEPLLSVTDKDRISASFEHISKTSPDFVDYVIMNESDEPFVDDIYNDMPISNNGLSQSCKLKKINMPPYAFIAFGFFLKIPGYAKIILRDRKQAQSILKLLLGANKSKDDEFGLSLSTMPFESLRELLSDAKISSDSNMKFELNNFFSENSILTLILSILSSISHHPHKKMIPHFTRKIVPDSSSSSSSAAFASDSSNPSIKITEEKSSNYWAKGTGFGTGSTIQQWDAEKTMMQQRMEEDHVACILEILSNFIECCNENINEKVMEIFDDSCIINALSSYLRNDSVLDISRHIPLYKSVLKLVKSLAYHTKLQTFLSKCNIYELIKNMKQFVDTYIKKIKLTEEESLFSLLNVLNATFETVETNLKPSLEEQIIPDDDADNLDENSEKKYCEILKEYQFDSFSIVTENENGTLRVNLPYYYEASLNEPANFNNSNRSKRLAQETVTISNSLPISYSSTVFVRCDEERLDVMKVLITGPQDTPYANGCFEFDVFFPADYPDSPPMINLQTTGNQTVRFNPNLYHDGKVCLSILNTWHGRPEERWNGQTSSFLQVLVSIQSLILVSEPYFNEPGYERSRGTPAGTASSIEHDANIRQATVRWGMLETLKKPSVCFKDPIRKHFLLKRKEIRIQCEKWLKEMELHINDKQIGQSVSKSYLSLKRHMNQLFEELDKLEKNESINNETTSKDES